MSARLRRALAGGSMKGPGSEPAGRRVTSPRSRGSSGYRTRVHCRRNDTSQNNRGTDSTAVTHDIVVTITANELDHRRGAGWTTGVMTGLPVPTIERKACTDGIRLLVTGDHGEAMHLARTHRLSTTAHKDVLTVAAASRCQYPGRRTPAPFLEAHHARWWHRNVGPTGVDNGIVLCSYDHHHLVHEPGSPVEIRCADGDMWIVPRGWRGPLHEHQRRQRGPAAEPALDLLRRQHDPARNPITA